jgi:hypothetical protein
MQSELDHFCSSFLAEEIHLATDKDNLGSDNNQQERENFALNT